MEIYSKDIEEYIYLNYDNYDNTNINEIYDSLYDLYNIKTSSEKYVIDKNINYYITQKQQKEEIYNERRNKLKNLRLLELPEQRSVEWYALRKKILTASSLASALGKCHFTSRDELLLGKIEETPYVSNPITEWGVKYEDVAIMFYEELYNTKILDFGLVPHPEFTIFGASPDGICDDLNNGKDDYIARMIEIKCPPKRKFTKTVPHHYWMQMQGQLEVCDLDECDFFQVKLEEYESFEEYSKDRFLIDDIIQPGRTSLNYPKGIAATYKIDDNLIYDYAPLNLNEKEVNEWLNYRTNNDSSDDKKKENLFEMKLWRIERYECTLVKRDHKWWNDTIADILKFSKDLEFYQKDDNINILKEKVTNSKKRGKRMTTQPQLDSFLLVSDDES
jgi:putative phage-type endonuclease